MRLLSELALSVMEASSPPRGPSVSTLSFTQEDMRACRQMRKAASEIEDGGEWGDGNGGLTGKMCAKRKYGRNTQRTERPIQLIYGNMFHKSNSWQK